MANQILAGAVINAGMIIAGVDASNPPYVKPPPTLQNYFQASLSDWTIVAGSVTQPTSGTFAWTRDGGSGWVAGYEISGLTAGTEYTISYEIRNPNGGSTIDALVSTVLAGGTWLSRQSTESSDFVTFTSTWTQPNQTTAYLNILSDNEGQSGEIRSVSIVALISNEPPVISGIDASYTLTEGQDTVVTAVGTDPESDAITWSYNISGSTGSISASDFTLTGMYNNNLGTSANGLTLTIGGGGSSWVSYQNLPTYLTGLLCTTGINEGDSLSFTIPACTVYMLRVPNWDGVDTTGWTEVESGQSYLTDYSGMTVYSKEFSAGTYNFDNQSAMYMFAGETIDMTVSQTDNVFTITPGTTDISTQITFTATDIEGNATSVSSDITFATPAPAPAPAPELAPDTIASLHINGTASGIVDSSTNSYSVTLHDNVSVVDVSPYSTGKSMTFDGNGDMVSATVDNGVGAVEFTVEFWMYRESDTGFIFNNRTGGENTDGFDIRSDLDITTASNRFFSGRSLENNRWYHVALTRDSSYLTRLFIDGVNVGTSTVSNAFTGSSVYIGGSPHGNVGYFNGKIADFRIVTGEAVYTENFSVPTSPLGV